MAESHREEIAKLEALYAGNPGGRVFVHLAEALRRGGEHERARSILTEGLARHQDSATGYVVLGRVLADLDNAAEAEMAFRRVLDLDDGNLVALRSLADLARASGRDAEALPLYRELLSRSPSQPELTDIVVRLEAAVAAGAAQAEAIVAEEPLHVDLATSHDEASTGTASGVDAETAGAGQSAPGDAGPVEPADASFGMIDIDVLPGDLGALVGASPDALPEHEEPLAELSWTGLGDSESDLVAALEGDYPDTDFDLSELGGPDAAAPLEIHLLDAVVEGPGDDFADASDSSLADIFADSDAAATSPDIEEVLPEPSWITEPAALEFPTFGEDRAEDALPFDDDLDEGGFGAALGGAAAAGSDPALRTETMAQLYRAQGFPERAAEVYRALVAERPDDEHLRSRLADVEAELETARLHVESLVVEDDAGEVWLRTGMPAAAGEENDPATPYTWTEPADEQAPVTEPGPPIGGYLQALVNWRPARAAEVSADDVDTAELSDHGAAPEAADHAAAPAQFGGWSPDALDEPWAAAPSDATDTSAPVADADAGLAAAADVEAEPWLAGALSLDEPVSEPLRASEPLHEPVSEPPHEPVSAPLDEPWAEHAPLDAGGADEPWMTPAAPEAPEAPASPAAPEAPVPEPAAARAPERRNADPVEAAFDEWYGETATPAPAPAAAVSAEPASAAETVDEDEDEDLEMFRSWLQSLKR